MPLTMTEELWKMKAKMELLNHDFEEAKKVIVQFTDIIKQQEQEIGRLNSVITAIRERVRSEHLSIPELANR